MSDNETYEQRVVNIELLLMHLQHDVEQLNKALLDQQAEIDTTRRALDQLAATVEDHTAESRSPEDERPPHY